MNLTESMESLLTPAEWSFCKRAGEFAATMGVQLWLTGGLVRDLLSGSGSKDLDISFSGSFTFPEKLAETLGIRIARTFPRYGCSVLELSDGTHCDMLPLRRESYPEPAGPPVVEFIDSIEEDLLRRDFAVNAMALSLLEDDFGELYDFYGGLKDLEEKKLTLLHERSFIDDPVRIFRGVRFQERFGFTLAESSYQVLTDSLKSGVFDSLPSSVFLRELESTLRQCSPSKVFSVFRDWNVLSSLKWPDYDSLDAVLCSSGEYVLRALSILSKKKNIKTKRVQYLTMLSVLVLLPDTGLEFFTSRYKPPAGVVKILQEISACSVRLKEWLDGGADAALFPLKRPRKPPVICGAMVLACLNAKNKDQSNLSKIARSLI